MRPYAVVLGEALVDLLEDDRDGERVYREAVGGAPLNVAVGIARLGHAVELVGSLGDDVLGRRVRGFLAEAGVGTGHLVGVNAATTIALTTFDGTEPDFHFYGEPPSYGLLAPEMVDPALVPGAALLYCGSIALLQPSVLATARAAWSSAGETGAIRTFDPNVRPRLLTDVAWLRRTVEEFAATADLVKLSAADAAALYRSTPQDAASHLAGLGARTVVVTMGGAGALVHHGPGAASATVAVPKVTAVDATGAGDATMAGLLHGLLAAPPADLAGWVRLVEFAVAVAGLTCEARGGATAIPTLARVHERFPDLR
jgi:sugar/nucleoside kinase (ribokinase family)